MCKTSLLILNLEATPSTTITNKTINTTRNTTSMNFLMETRGALYFSIKRLTIESMKLIPIVEIYAKAGGKFNLKSMYITKGFILKKTPAKILTRRTLPVA